MCRCLRDKERIVHLGVGITDLGKVWHIDIRRDHIDRRCCVAPYLHDLGYRSTGRIFSGFLALIQPAVCRKRQVIYCLACGSHFLHIRCHIVCSKDLSGICSKDLLPVSGMSAILHGFPDTGLHTVCMSLHIRNKFCRNILCIFRISKIGMFPVRSLHTGLVFYLHADHGTHVFIDFLDMCHKMSKSIRISLHCLLTKSGKRRIFHAVKCHQSGLILALFHLGSRESHHILFHPFRRIHTLGILPCTKPKEDQMHFSFSRLVDKCIN